MCYEQGKQAGPWSTAGKKGTGAGVSLSSTTKWHNDYLGAIQTNARRTRKMNASYQASRRLLEQHKAVLL